MENKKKGLLRRILKWTGITFLALLIIIICIPIFFKGKIQDMVLEETNKTLTADVSLGEFDLTFLSSFPNLTVELTDMKVTGRDEFKGLNLINAKTFKAQVKLWDVISGDQIAINGIFLEDADIHVKVLQGGKANYDITIPDTAVVEEEAAEPSNFKLTLEKYALTNCNIIYDDQDGDMYAKITALNHEGKGDLTADVIDFETVTTMDALTYEMEGLNYLSEVKTDMTINLLMEFTETTSKFTLKENTIGLNNLKFAINGFYEMLEDEDNMDLQLDASKATFKELLSIVPAFYMSGYEGMIADGNLAMNGYVKGKMNDTEMPGWDFSLNIDKAKINYPDVPGSIDNIVLKANTKFAGGANMDQMTLDVNKFHADFVGNTLDATLKMRNPMTDPLIQSGIKAKVDLATLGQVMPLAEGESYSGKLDADVELDGRLSAIETEDYESFKAIGSLKLMDMTYASPDLPQAVDISEMTFLFSPQNLNLANLKARMGKSDFAMNGTIDNYLAYAFRDEMLKGSFDFNSNTLDLDDMMPAEEGSTETTSAETTEAAQGEGSMEGEEEPILIPGNIDFALNTNIKTLIYDGLSIQNVTGKVVVKDEVAYLDGLNMSTMGGTIGMTGNYNTQNHSKPKVDFAYDMNDISIVDITSYFTSVKTMMPIAEHAKGKFSTSFSMTGDLLPSLEPVYNSLNGKGDFFTSSMEVSGFEPMEKLATALQKDNLKSQTFKNLKVLFAFADGKINMQPFKTNIGKIPTEIQGFTTFEQDLNYDLNMMVPKEEIPAAMVKAVEDVMAKANGLVKGLNVGGLPAQIPVTAKVVGKVTAPKVTTDFKEAILKASGNLKDGMMDALNDAKDKAIDSVKTIVNDKVNDVKEDIEAKKQQILADAQVQADKVKAEAKRSADKVRKEGDAAADRLIAEAGNNPIKKKAAELAATKTRKEAEEKAQQIEATGNKKADDIMAAARKKADAL